MPFTDLSDGDLSTLCDAVENDLECIVIQFKGHFFEEGMDEKLYAQFESRLSISLLEKGYDFETLSEKHQEYVQNRIHRSLDLFKKEYESETDETDSKIL